MTSSDSARLCLRHAVAVLAYRAAKTIEGAPASFATYTPGPSSRTPIEILAHMGDLFDWAVTMTHGAPAWHNSTPLAWPEEAERFMAALKRFDDVLASDEEIRCPLEKLVHGPIADALTHTGQLSYLRRLSGAPIRGENYSKAAIVPGRIALTYDTVRVEFD